jgi:hypothetical protein
MMPISTKLQKDLLIDRWISGKMLKGNQSQLVPPRSEVVSSYFDSLDQTGRSFPDLPRNGGVSSAISQISPVYCGESPFGFI